MQIVNDKEKKTEHIEIDIMGVLSHALLVALGMSSLFFSLIPMVLSEYRLPSPASKIAILLGALVSLVLLEVSPAVVVLIFVAGMLIADGMKHEDSVWYLIAKCGIFSVVFGAGWLAFLAVTSHVDMGSVWVKTIETMISNAKGMVVLTDASQWNELKEVFLYDGPFLYLCTVILSVWITIAMIAHFNWLKIEAYSAEKLRAINLHPSVSLLFICGFALSFFVISDIRHVLNGVTRVLSCLLFIQGSVVLSQVLERKKVAPIGRTIIFVFSTIVGFYFLVALGVVSAWFLAKYQVVGVALNPNKNLEEIT